MPFCQIDLGAQCSVTIDGNEDLLTGAVMNSNCTHFERCVEGVLESTECTDGTIFHVNGAIDGADVGAECDVDKCDDWANICMYCYTIQGSLQFIYWQTAAWEINKYGKSPFPFK